MSVRVWLPATIVCMSERAHNMRHVHASGSQVKWEALPTKVWSWLF